MYYSEPKLLSVIRPQVGEMSCSYKFSSDMDENKFNIEIKKFKKNYPDVDKYKKDYIRPKFLAPTLDSPDGNSLCYFSLAINTLKNAKFKQEASELQHLMFTDYKDHYGYISQYLDIGKILTFDEYQEQYFFAKKRGLSLDINPVTFSYNEEKIEQLPEFIRVSIEKIKQLTSDNFDFNETNVFGRNMLWYVDTPEITSYLINNTDIDIFHIDKTGKNVFQKCFLHEDIECSYGTFLTILDNMKKQDFDSTQYFLQSFDIFGSILEAFKKYIDNDIINIRKDKFNPKSENLNKFEILPEVCSILRDFDKPNLEVLINLIANTQQKIMIEGSSEKLKFITEIYSNILEEYIPENKSSITRKSIKF